MGDSFWGFLLSQAAASFLFVSHHMDGCMYSCALFAFGPHLCFLWYKPTLQCTDDSINTKKQIPNFTAGRSTLPLHPPLSPNLWYHHSLTTAKSLFLSLTHTHPTPPLSAQRFAKSSLFPLLILSSSLLLSPLRLPHCHSLVLSPRLPSFFIRS